MNTATVQPYLKDNFMNNTDNTIETPLVLNKKKMLILAVQHMFAMFGATILVPILVMGFFKDATGEELTSVLPFLLLYSAQVPVL